MSIKAYRPTTPAQRQKPRRISRSDYDQETDEIPCSLARSKWYWQNNQGRITVRHRGGGVKRHYRILTYTLPQDSQFTIMEIEYDPNRSARIARVQDQNGAYYYVIADNSNMKKGATFATGKDVAVETSNRMPIENIPVGTFIYAIELTPVLAAPKWSAPLVLAPSSWLKRTATPPSKCHPAKCAKFSSIAKLLLVQLATSNIKTSKLVPPVAAAAKGIRPTVRGVVMNATDHPHGGGDGGRHGTGKAPRTPWGKLTLGYRTRHNKKTDKMIVRSRHEGKRK